MTRCSAINSSLSFFLLFVFSFCCPFFFRPGLCDVSSLGLCVTNARDGPEPRDNPAALKVTTETLGFQHLDLEVTAPRRFERNRWRGGR